MIPNELIELCTNLQKKVLDLETTKTIQALEIDSLKRRVKKLEKKQRSRTHKLRRLYKVGLSAKVISSDDEASLGDQEDASKQGRKILDIDADPDMFGVHDLHGDEVFVEIEEPVVNAATTTTTTATTTVADEVEMTLAQTLIEIKSAKPKAKWIVMQEPSESTLTISSQQPSQVKGQGLKDKGKEKMIEPEKPLKKKDQNENVNTFIDFKNRVVEGTLKGKRVFREDETIGQEAFLEESSIFDYKIIEEGKINIDQIIRADGSLKRYSAVIHMLKNFDKEDLETLWKNSLKLVRCIHVPEEGYERVL
ncbi:hypothetical protein Tco_0328656 [Tanacetum coccineum]